MLRRALSRILRGSAGPMSGCRCLGTRDLRRAQCASPNSSSRGVVRSRTRTAAWCGWRRPNCIEFPHASSVSLRKARRQMVLVIARCE